LFLNDIFLPRGQTVASAVFVYLRQVNGVNGKDSFRSMCVCVCVCVCVHSEPINQTSVKGLKLHTSILTCLFPGTVET